MIMMILMTMKMRRMAMSTSDTVIISSLLNGPFRGVIAFKTVPSYTTYGHSQYLLKKEKTFLSVKCSQELRYL